MTRSDALALVAYAVLVGLWGLALLYVWAMP